VTIRPIPHVLLRGFCVLLLLTTLAVVVIAVAQAEPDSIDRPDLNGAICGQMIRGETPIEIAARLHQRDPQLSMRQAGQQVLDALPECG
jgi:hypothetical protein